MIYELTFQVRAADFDQGLSWYKTLLNKEPDSIPHEGFAEWELIPGSWLQLAEGTPSEGSGPLRMGVASIERERDRLKSELNIKEFDIHSRAEVPVKWATFNDPWGNRIGFFEYLDEMEKDRRINSILGE